MSAVFTPGLYTIAEYLRLEELADIPNEFHDGRILAMSGTSPGHALITANLTSAIHVRLHGKACRIYSSNLSVAVVASNRAFHPDASVICGPLEFHPADAARQLVINPRVIIEVLSPTTEACDRGDKFEWYRQAPSLQEYVLVSQVTPRVESFLRRADGSWLFTPFIGAAAVAAFRAIELEVPLAEIYAGVEFAASPPPVI